MSPSIPPFRCSQERVKIKRGPLSLPLRAPSAQSISGKLRGMPLLRIYALRIALLGGALQVTEFCCVALITHRLHTTVSGLFSMPISLVLPMLLPAIVVAFAIYWAGARFLERRSLRELPLGSALPNLALGVLSGFLLCAFVFAALAVQGSVTYETYAGFGRAPAAAMIFIAGVV
jgi:hypothetical protein